MVGARTCGGGGDPGGHLTAARGPDGREGEEPGEPGDSATPRAYGSEGQEVAETGYPEEEPELAPGVTALDHTADVGFSVSAESLPELFHRSATGMTILLYGDKIVGQEPHAGDPTRAPLHGSDFPTTPLSPDPAASIGASSEHSLELEAPDTAELLAAWLRELLYLNEVHGLAYEGAQFHLLDGLRLRASVGLRLRDAVPVRELKGVTYHGLEVTGGGGAWTASVIFDV